MRIILEQLRQVDGSKSIQDAAMSEIRKYWWYADKIKFPPRIAWTWNVWFLCSKVLSYIEVGSPMSVVNEIEAFIWAGALVKEAMLLNVLVEERLYVCSICSKMAIAGLILSRFRNNNGYIFVNSSLTTP